MNDREWLLSLTDDQFEAVTVDRQHAFADAREHASRGFLRRIVNADTVAVDVAQQRLEAASVVSRERQERLVRQIAVLREMVGGSS